MRYCGVLLMNCGAGEVVWAVCKIKHLIKLKREIIYA